MGFGFNLLLIFVVLPLIGILLLIGALTKKAFVWKILLTLLVGIAGLALLAGVMNCLNAKTVLDKKDYYGQYVVNRNYFSGKQADWQYEHLRFEIKENDSIYFYCTEKEKIVKTYKGTITTTKPYNSERLIINMEQPTYHVMSANPTTYRSAWDFYLVFQSPKFHNVYFKKGDWTPSTIKVKK